MKNISENKKIIAIVILIVLIAGVVMLAVKGFNLSLIHI